MNDHHSLQLMIEVNRFENSPIARSPT